MKKFLIIGTILTITTQAFGIELLSYKSTNSNIVKLSEAKINSIWTSKTPACIKDGSKIVGVNQAFLDKKLGYRDCSSSDKAREKQKMLGYKVVKIDFTSLPTSIAKTVMGVSAN